MRVFCKMTSISLDKLVDTVNKVVKETEEVMKWFVCHGCNELKIGIGAHYMQTSKWGYDRPFCPDCTNYCGYCDEYFAKTMSYRHDDCRQPNTATKKDDGH